MSFTVRWEKIDTPVIGMIKHLHRTLGSMPDDCREQIVSLIIPAFVVPIGAAHASGITTEFPSGTSIICMRNGTCTIHHAEVGILTMTRASRYVSGEFSPA